MLKKMMTGTKLRLYSKRASCKNSMIYEHSSTIHNNWNMGANQISTDR